MVLITKEEKEAIVKRFPRTHIVRTMKQKSSRHRYYCEEARSVMAYLAKLRGDNTVDAKEGASHGYKQKNRRNRARLS